MLHGSREYLRVRLTVSAAGADEVDLTGVTVDMRVGLADTWHPAEVTERSVSNGVGRVAARLLIGAGTEVVPAVGEHRVFTRLTTAAEAIVTQASPYLSVGKA